MATVSEGFLQSFIMNTGILTMPYEQRIYEWTSKEIERLFLDMEEIDLSNQFPQLKYLYMGEVTYVQRVCEDFVNYYYIYDGKQRSITFYLIILNVIKQYKKYGLSYQNLIPYIVNDNLDEKYYYKFLLDDRQDIILKLLVDEIIKGEKKIMSSTLKRDYLYKAWVYIDNKLKFFSEEELKLLLNKLNRLLVGFSNCESETDNASKRFQTSNDRGKPVSKLTKIKSRLYHGLHLEGESEWVEKQIWRPIEERLFIKEFDSNYPFEVFFKCYFLNRTSSSELTINWVDRLDVFKIKNFDSTHDFFKDLYDYFKYFDFIYNYENVDNYNIQNELRKINRLTKYKLYPFLFELTVDYYERKVTDEEYVEILQILQNYYLRCYVVGRKPQVIADFINKSFYSPNIDDAIDKTKYIPSLLNRLITPNNKSSSHIYPLDDEFKREFSNKEWKNESNTGHIRLYIQEGLENELRGPKQQIVIDTGVNSNGNFFYSNDHTVAKKLSAKGILELGEGEYKQIKKHAIHLIGNQSLVKYNQEMNNKSFSEKKHMDCGLKDEELYLTRRLLNYNRFGLAEIRKESDYRAKLALKQWPQLDVGQIPLNFVNDKIDVPSK